MRRYFYPSGADLRSSEAERTSIPVTSSGEETGELIFISVQKYTKLLALIFMEKNPGAPRWTDLRNASEVKEQCKSEFPLCADIWMMNN
jgi:hypothetical protein